MQIRHTKVSIKSVKVALLCVSLLYMSVHSLTCLCAFWQELQIKARSDGNPYEEDLVICRLLMFCTLSCVPGLLPVTLLSAVNDPAVRSQLGGPADITLVAID